MRLESSIRNSTKQIPLLGLLLAMLPGCASVPEGSPDVKQQALSFSPPADKGGLYVIRPPAGSAKAVPFSMNIDFEEFGTLVEQTYLFRPVSGGNHALNVTAYGGNVFRFSAVAGSNCFVTVTPGWGAPQFAQITEREGRSQVQKFKLSGNNRYEFESKAANNK